MHCKTGENDDKKKSLLDGKSESGIYTFTSLTFPPEDCPYPKKAFPGKVLAASGFFRKRAGILVANSLGRKDWGVKLEGGKKN